MYKIVKKLRKIVSKIVNTIKMLNSRTSYENLKRIHTLNSLTKGRSEYKFNVKILRGCYNKFTFSKVLFSLKDKTSMMFYLHDLKWYRVTKQYHHDIYLEEKHLDYIIYTLEHRIKDLEKCK